MLCYDMHDANGLMRMIGSLYGATACTMHISIVHPMLPEVGSSSTSSVCRSTERDAEVVVPSAFSM